MGHVTNIMEMLKRLNLEERLVVLENIMDGINNEIKNDPTEENDHIKSDLYRPEFVEDNRKRSKEVFGLMMRAHFRKNDDNKFQPCQDELDLLNSMPKSLVLCANLRDHASLSEFWRILHPGNIKDQTGHTTADKECLKEKNSIFHLHQHSIEEDVKEFCDLEKRADALAGTIVCSDSSEIHLSLLDGHGRMIVCILRALQCKDVCIRIYETEPVVHEYHRFVLPQCIEKVNGSIIRCLNPKYDDEIKTNGGFIYLNFCSIPSLSDKTSLTAHFQKQTIDDWVPYCCKENVLKYIWKVIHPPYYNTVMVSCVIKDMLDTGEYLQSFTETLGSCLTGFGFLHQLLHPDVFSGEIISIRPENEIEWKDKDKRKPKKLRKGKMGCPFVTLLVKPRDWDESEFEYEENDCESEGGIGNENLWKWIDLMESEFLIGGKVRVTRGKYSGHTGVIEKRTPVEVCVNGKRINLNNIESLNIAK